MPIFFLHTVTSALLVLSGALKLRATGRAGLQPSVLAVGELLAAPLIMFLALPGPLAGSGVARAAIPLAFLLVVGSSVRHAMRLRAYRRYRSETEGGRLVSYVKYMSGSDETP